MSIAHVAKLMLMNLIIALFLAPFLFLLNSLITAQHDFWLFSFAWMICMLYNVFKCFATSGTITIPYIAGKHYKYVLSVWLAPLHIPLVAHMLTIAGPVYGCTLWWLDGQRAVLYLLFLLTSCSVVGAAFGLCLKMQLVQRTRKAANNDIMSAWRNDFK